MKPIQIIVLVIFVIGFTHGPINAAAMAPLTDASVNAAPELKPILEKAKLLKITWGRLAHKADSHHKSWKVVRAQVEALALLDLKGHLALKTKGTDQDLKCILNGLYLDAPKRIAAFESARDKASRISAAEGLTLWTQDHIDILSAPKTAESGLDCVIEFGADKP